MSRRGWQKTDLGEIFDESAGEFVLNGKMDGRSFGVQSLRLGAVVR